MATPPYRHTTPSGREGSIYSLLAANQNKFFFELHALLVKATSDATIAAMAAAGDGATLELLNFARVYREVGTSGTGSRSTANEKIAEAMHEAVLKAYVTNVENYPERRTTTPYRIGQNRYSGGALLRALQSEDMFKASYNGIAWGNVSVLDTEAAHWARLNYGAYGNAPRGPVLAFPPEPVRITIFGASLGAITGGGHPGKNMLMPRGFWAAEGDGRPPGFYPTGPVANRQVAGITARHFLDYPAFKALQDNLTPQYEGLFKIWEDQAKRNQGPVARANVKIRAGQASHFSRGR